MRRLAGLVAVLGVLGSARAASAAVCDSGLFVVLDRSCSMDRPVGGGETRTKWVVALEAINTMLTQYAGKLQFGLTMFPDKTGTSCAQDGPIPVPVAAGTESMVMSTLAAPASFPSGPCVTNITTGVNQVNVEPSMTQMYVPGTRRGFVLLITDGMETCDSDAMTNTRLAALYAKGYPTFVVGFGGAVDPVALDMFAMSGGVPRVGATSKYYQANTAADLQQALREIAGSAVGDPEFGGCSGTPCPDGRCFAAGESCVNKHCVVPRPDGGAGSGDGGGGGGDGGGNEGGDGGGGDSGCGCRTGARGGAAWAGALALVAALALLRKRRYE